MYYVYTRIYTIFIDVQLDNSMNKMPLYEKTEKAHENRFYYFHQLVDAHEENTVIHSYPNRDNMETVVTNISTVVASISLLSVFFGSMPCQLSSFSSPIRFQLCDVRSIN